MFPPDHPTRWQVGFRLGAALRGALLENGDEPMESGRDHARARHPNRCALWQSFEAATPGAAEAKAATIKWLPPIPVELAVSDDSPALERGVAED
jgi:hypothetical protein